MSAPRELILNISLDKTPGDLGKSWSNLFLISLELSGVDHKMVFFHLKSSDLKKRWYFLPKENIFILNSSLGIFQDIFCLFNEFLHVKQFMLSYSLTCREVLYIYTYLFIYLYISFLFHCSLFYSLKDFLA